jgi:hypothetical protein
MSHTGLHVCMRTVVTHSSLFHIRHLQTIKTLQGIYHSQKLHTWPLSNNALFVQKKKLQSE